MESFLYIDLFVFAYCYSFFFFFFNRLNTPQLSPAKNPHGTHSPSQPKQIYLCVGRGAEDELFTSSGLTQINNIPIDIVYSRTLRPYISVLLHLNVTRSGASNSDQITQTHSH